jgi:protein tyrosine/serine phosphatase
MLQGIGWPSENREEAPAPPLHSFRRLAADRADLGFLLFLSIIVPLSHYGVMFARGNLHEVVPQRVYRSGQPSPGQLRAWIRRYGLKTVVSLRGTTAPGADEEKAVVTSMGADMIYLSLSAHELIPSDELVRLIDVIQTAKKPMLLHCQHGVDRAGTASALAAWLVGGQPYDRARWQAYVPSGPWKHPKGAPHVSDTLALYDDYCRWHAVNPDDTALFKFWAREVYRPNNGSAGLDIPFDPNAARLCNSFLLPYSPARRSEAQPPFDGPPRPPPAPSLPAEPLTMPPGR